MDLKSALGGIKEKVNDVLEKTEIDEKKFRVDDAVAATKAALLFGGGAKTKARGYGVFAEGLPEQP